MQLWREQNTVLAADQRHFSFDAASQRFVQVHRRVESGESASGMTMLVFFIRRLLREQLLVPFPSAIRAYTCAKPPSTNNSVPVM